MNSFKTIAWVTTAVFAVITIVGNGPSTYRFAILFLAPLLWLVYFFRTRLHLHPVHFAVFASALVLHNAGAFGAYRQAFYGIDFDAYVHFYFGVAGGLIVARGLRGTFQLLGWQMWVGTAIVILGLGAIHELVEYGSTLLLGPEKGMLKLNSPDAKTDTQKDLLNNLGGTLLALGLYSVGLRVAARRAQEPGCDSEPQTAST
jgi:uncharacterized membrane protein YjdF